MKKFIYTVFNEQSKPIEFISKQEDINNSAKDVNTSTEKVDNQTTEDNDQSKKKQIQQLLQLQLQLKPIQHYKPFKENKHNNGEKQKEKGNENNKIKDGEYITIEENTQTEESSTLITNVDPLPGMEFNTLADCRQFCINFSKRNGFLLVTHNSSHKKGYLIMECVYHRKYRNAKKKKEPTADEENNNEVVKKTRNRKSKRKGCNCRIVFNRRSRSQKFTLTSMFLEHNHPLPTN